MNIMLCLIMFEIKVNYCHYIITSVNVSAILRCQQTGTLGYWLPQRVGGGADSATLLAEFQIVASTASMLEEPSLISVNKSPITIALIVQASNCLRHRLTQFETLSIGNSFHGLLLSRYQVFHLFCSPNYILPEQFPSW